jgi:hypothetical protein
MLRHRRWLPPRAPVTSRPIIYRPGLSALWSSPTAFRESSQRVYGSTRGVLRSAFGEELQPRLRRCFTMCSQLLPDLKTREKTGSSAFLGTMARRPTFKT